MTNEWVIDVISDLRSFAEQNGLPRLAAQLQETALLAALEVSSRPGGTVIAKDAGEARNDHRVVVAGKVT